MVSYYWEENHCMLLESKRNNAKSEKGSLLVEIVVVGIIVGSLTAILGIATMFLTTSHIVQETSKATALGQEAMEIVRNVRDGTDWAVDGLGILALSPAVYHPEQSGSPSKWILVSGSETIGAFARQIQFEEVSRDGNDDIAAVGAVDPDIVKTVVTVSWQERGRNHEVQVNGYFSDWR